MQFRRQFSTCKPTVPSTDFCRFSHRYSSRCSKPTGDPKRFFKDACVLLKRSEFFWTDQQIIKKKVFFIVWWVFNGFDTHRCRGLLCFCRKLPCINYTPSYPHLPKTAMSSKNLKIRWKRRFWLQSINPYSFAKGPEFVLKLCIAISTCYVLWRAPRDLYKITPPPMAVNTISLSQKGKCFDPGCKISFHTTNGKVTQ